jgi:hypothetical protein
MHQLKALDFAVGQDRVRLINRAAILDRVYELDHVTARDLGQRLPAPSWQQLALEIAPDLCSSALLRDMASEIFCGDRAESVIAADGKDARIVTALDCCDPLTGTLSSFGQRQLADCAERSGRRMRGTAVPLPQDIALAALVGDANLEARDERIGNGVALASRCRLQRVRGAIGLVTAP